MLDQLCNCNIIKDLHSYIMIEGSKDVIMLIVLTLFLTVELDIPTISQPFIVCFIRKEYQISIYVQVKVNLKY